jgi:hypothetical protein
MLTRWLKFPMKLLRCWSESFRKQFTRCVIWNWEIGNRGKEGTGNREQGTGNREQGTGNWEEREQGIGKRGNWKLGREGTGNWELDLYHVRSIAHY